MGRIRRIIVDHPAFQAVGFIAALHLYIWWVQPVASDGERTLGMALLTSFPVFSNWLHRERFRDIGLRFDNVARSGREVLIATIIGGRPTSLRWRPPMLGWPPCS